MAEEEVVRFALENYGFDTSRFGLSSVFTAKEEIATFGKNELVHFPVGFSYSLGDSGLVG